MASLRCPLLLFPFTNIVIDKKKKNLKIIWVSSHLNLTGQPDFELTY
jgi:hypothetical protein